MSVRTIEDLMDKWGAYKFCCGCGHQVFKKIGNNTVYYCDIKMNENAPIWCKAKGMDEYQLLKNKGLKSIYGKYKNNCD